jgi:hypothetical protein
MTDEIAFLQATVLELQAIAAAAPEIAGDLYRMAEDLEAQAAKLLRARRDRFGRTDAPRTQQRGNGRPHRSGGE